MKTTIFYFSATGNSLYVTKKLADAMGGGAVHSMANFQPAEPIGGENEAVGLIFPSYYGNLPRIVKRFIGEMNINSKSFIFCVSTMGISLGSGALTQCAKTLDANGLKLQYGCGVVMPRNYIVKYNPLSPETAMKYNKKAASKIAWIAADIKSKKTEIRNMVGNLLTTDTLYKNIKDLDEKFFVEDQCNGCGQCEKICPVQNIKLTDGKPKWQHHCEHCVACIHWCPNEAIQFGNRTQNRRRYHNPEIKVSELLRD